ncbi:HAD family hydrolase [Kribbella sp. NBC_00889]|uniref:HAD family hydrolase n=1 Tax=Kribbella sp. NBC_00889 TaxID=2975974 RepID=UPI00386382F7|nr:HAD-IA family hydrolase [Kribbella sp. NBC_00889]
MALALGVDPDKFTQAFDDTTQERFRGAYGDLATTLRAMAHRSGGDPTDDQVRRAAELRRELARNLLGAAPAATLQTLTELSAAGWCTGLVSNITAETRHQWSESTLARHLDAAAFSCEVGAAKPEPAIYLAACSALGIVPSECVYVADGSDNELRGAADLGMHVIRTTEHSDSDPDWPGPSICSFSELPALIGAPA